MEHISAREMTLQRTLLCPCGATLSEWIALGAPEQRLHPLALQNVSVWIKPHYTLCGKCAKCKRLYRLEMP